MLESKKLTTNDLIVGFGVSSVTLWKWRNRTNDPLPWGKLSGHKAYIIEYDLEDVLCWALRNNKEFKQPESIL